MKASSRRLFGAAMALAITAAVAAVSPVSTQEKKPNILFILADNLGFGDLGVYGGGELRGAPTPRIDQLAAEKSQADAVPRRTGMHALPCRIDDGALFHPLWAISGRRGGQSHLAPGDGDHDGRDAA